MKNAELLVSSGQSINTATTYQKERAAHGGLAALNTHYSFSLTSRFTMKQPNYKRTNCNFVSARNSCIFHFVIFGIWIFVF